MICEVINKWWVIGTCSSLEYPLTSVAGMILGQLPGLAILLDDPFPPVLLLRLIFCPVVAAGSDI